MSDTYNNSPKPGDPGKPNVPDDREPMDVTIEQAMLDLCAAIDEHKPDKLITMIVKDTGDGGYQPMYFMSGVENTELIGYLEVWKHDILNIVNGAFADDDDDEDDDGPEFLPQPEL